jgi:succinate dehydrogenase/fumarate reductase flavoprotein subunit
MIKEVIETDVLCVGGGIAGLMAAIHAGELGARVVVADKANTVRSGCAGMGNDHFRSYIPEVHGPDITPIINGLALSPIGGMRSREFVRVWMEKSFDMITLWESWGIPMKYEGRYEFAGHGFPGRPLASLKYSGGQQKTVLTREALKRGATIMNRVMVFDLLPGDEGLGAVAIDVRKDRLIEFHAKSIVLGTGLCTRLYPAPTPACMFNLANSPNNTGDGRAMAYRAGAELANAELTMRWAGPKYFARCGKGTWVGVFRDPGGKPIGPFVTKPDRRYGDSAADIWDNVFEDYSKAGKGPVYMDCTGISDEDYSYMVHWMAHEGNTSLLDHVAAEGVDLRKTPVEFMTYEMTFSGGVLYNEKGETSVRGLYAAGDELFGGISCASTFGWIAGGHAAAHAKTANGVKSRSWSDEVEQREETFLKIRNRESGASWQETNIALQQLMSDYAGLVRSESLLRAGLVHVQRLKEKALALLTAKNPHELMHALEVLNLIDLGELLFVAASERKETRKKHIRADYPFTNPLLEKLLIVKKVDGKAVTEWREIKR